MEQIIVTISPSGEVQVSVNGVKGKRCKDLTKNLESALGNVKETHTTREYNEHEQEQRVAGRNRA